MLKRLALAAALVMVAAAPSMAQTWPAKTVHIMVPFGPGSTPDIVARIIADGLKRQYPDSAFVVENKPGASGNIGTDAVAKAAPDGGTIGISIGGRLGDTAEGLVRRADEALYEAKRSGRNCVIADARADQLEG